MSSPNVWNNLPLPDRRSFDYDPPKDPLSILHIDDDLIVVDKPSGLLSVPGRDLPDCLESRLRDKHPETLLVHRLDMATSGVMIFARNKPAQRHLGLQFERRHIKKTYIAEVYGEPIGKTGRINLPLIADWPNRPRQMVSFEIGKPSVTDWEVISTAGKKTRLALHPITGRSHQLRVHCWAMGHPIFGDRIYATDEIFYATSRLQLHAQTLDLRHPKNGEPMAFSADCPF